MTLDVWLAFCAASVALAIVPGPTVTVIVANSLRYGARAGLMNVAGTQAGAIIWLAIAALGLQALIALMGVWFDALRYVGAAYLIWLAWKIARAAGVDQGQSGSRPFSFWQAAAFQWVNPKAWIMAVGVVATYTPREGFFVNLLLSALVLGLVNYPSISVWTLFGSTVGRALRTPQALRVFNGVMAGLLLLSLVPIFMEHT